MVLTRIWRCQKRKLIIVFLTIGLLISSVFIVTVERLLADSPLQMTTTADSPHANRPLHDIQFDIQFSSEIIAPELTGQEYFVNYRLEREKFRQEIKEMLALLLDSPVPETQALAQKQWLNLTQTIQQEAEIESSLKIKGFTDAVSQVKPGSVEVIIFSSALSQEQIADIKKVVTRITGEMPENITITTRE